MYFDSSSNYRTAPCVSFSQRIPHSAIVAKSQKITTHYYKVFIFGICDRTSTEPMLKFSPNLCGLCGLAVKIFSSFAPSRVKKAQSRKGYRLWAKLICWIKQKRSLYFEESWFSVAGFAAGGVIACTAATALIKPKPSTGL